jgi:hypothetical protein
MHSHVGILTVHPDVTINNPQVYLNVLYCVPLSISFGAGLGHHYFRSLRRASECAGIAAAEKRRWMRREIGGRSAAPGRNRHVDSDCAARIIAGMVFHNRIQPSLSICAGVRGKAAATAAVGGRGGMCAEQCVPISGTTAARREKFGGMHCGAACDAACPAALAREGARASLVRNGDLKIKT